MIRRLRQNLKDIYEGINVEFIPEPSISLPNLSAVLEKFYKDTDSWAYPLQLGVSAAHEIHFQEMREAKYDVLLFDAPYSSFVYCSIHEKNGRLSKEELDSINSVARPFPFDVVIMVQEDKDITIDRIMKRNQSVVDGEELPDLDINDFSYLDEHIKDFREFQDEYIAKYFPDAHVITLEHLPEDSSDDYETLLDELCLAIDPGLMRSTTNKENEFFRSLRKTRKFEKDEIK